LVRVAADAWIEKLFVKIQYYIDNPPEEEEAQPPAEEEEGAEGAEPKPPKSMLTPLEESV
jgi:hypothetical protein